MKKADFKTLIKSYLGYPYVKVELPDYQLNNIIDRTRSMHLKWAVGNSTQEVFFTMVLTGGRFYSLPTGVTEVIKIKDYSTGLGNANTLFTVENFMMTHGMLRFVQGGSFVSLIDYHLGLEFIELLDKYTTSDFAWLYHRYKNVISLSPTPSATDSWDSSSTNFMLVHAFMAEGYDIDFDPIDNQYIESIYEDPWFQEYSIALAKITLGHIRRKFSQFNSIGNIGISLDGDQLIQEGKEEKERLEEKLMNAEAYEGYPIMIG